MTLDIILAIFIAFFAIRGWRRGLIGEIVETVGVFAAALATVRLYPKLEDILGLESITGRIVAAVIVFVAIMLALYFIRKLVQGLLDKANIQFIEKTIGLVVGALKAGLIIAVLSAVLLRAGDGGRQIVADSHVARVNIKFFAWITNILPDEWETKVDKALGEM